MKRLPFLLVLAALAISLWFHWRRGGPAAALVPAPAAETGPVLPSAVESMDFSGTGLSDDAWKLESRAAPAVPLTIPEPDLVLPPLPALPEAAWDPALPLAPGPTPVTPVPALPAVHPP